MFLISKDKLDCLNELLDKIDRIDATVKRVASSAIHNNGNNNDENKNDNNNNDNSNEVERVIKSLFKNNNELCNDYIELIIKNEGFDDLSTFCQLNDNDLKEIGINKKGHRMKFLNYFQSYKENQLLIDNINNINQSVNDMAQAAGSAAGAGEDTLNEGM